jgi:hypothetical protein
LLLKQTTDKVQQEVEPVSVLLLDKEQVFHTLLTDLVQLPSLVLVNLAAMLVFKLALKLPHMETPHQAVLELSAHQELKYQVHQM